MFLSNKKCCHSYCTDCISKHVATKIQQNINSINCPGLNCKLVLEPEFCRSIVLDQVFDRWVNALCESMILGSQKFNCPFKDCLAMLIDDGVEVVTMLECPYYRRLLCAQYKVPWHSGLGCDEFKRGIGKDDLLMMEMARNKNWRRCSNCKFYIEKKKGVGFNSAMDVERGGPVIIIIVRRHKDPSSLKDYVSPNILYIFIGNI
ncbi:hypothetical protein GIB67_041008 [Kingdonia uniflora]|uniref:RBR-type E3 ubiquitin transferase n=1 Tax=Kingdonia uniflora TaxID=39325 RepID=A0A7J7NC65_9MAGN|nr:hypothetical protein GIB67_041008 [Kingdonia uniflora]